MQPPTAVFRISRVALLLALLPLLAGAQAFNDFYGYIVRVDTESVLIAWGRPGDDGNSIGRESEPMGEAEVWIDGRRIEVDDANWARIDGLEPDVDYLYQLHVDGEALWEGTVRTMPEEADRLTFIVIGDYGTGSRTQRELGTQMAELIQQRRSAGDPVRFVITTGDNIYGDRVLFWYRRSGDRDRHWESKFFDPYSDVIRHVPFYPSLGNHDTADSENFGDLAVFKDNFFIEDSTFYTFEFADLAEFFALDTTAHGAGTTLGPEGEQAEWLLDRLEAANGDAVPWRIPFFHHPIFTAGPRHRPAADLGHLVGLFRDFGVRVAFSGHEHNFQYSEVSEATGNILWIISGAGGQLRRGRLRTDRMRERRIAGWSAEAHFLLVEIDGEEMVISRHELGRSEPAEDKLRVELEPKTAAEGPP